MIAKKMVPDLGQGKGHGKSWKFKSSKDYEPCEGQALALWKPMDLGYSDSNNVMCCIVCSPKSLLFHFPRYSHVPSLACRYGLRVLLCFICAPAQRGPQTRCPVVPEKSE